MKKIFYLLSFTVIVFLTGCSSNPTSPSSNNNNTDPNATDATSYQPLTVGSTWTYTGTAAYTVTITGDTTYNSKSWRVLTNSGASGVGFVRKDGSTYINFSPTGVPVAGEFTGLNETQGSTWSYDITPIPGYTSHYLFTNAEQGLTHVVLGKTYTKVIHVTLVLSIVYGGSTQTSTGDYYYAQGIGLIDANLGAAGGSQLSSYSIK